MIKLIFLLVVLSMVSKKSSTIEEFTTTEGPFNKPCKPSCGENGKYFFDKTLHYALFHFLITFQILREMLL